MFSIFWSTSICQNKKQPKNSLMILKKDGIMANSSLPWVLCSLATEIPLLFWLCFPLSLSVSLCRDRRDVIRSFCHESCDSGQRVTSVTVQMLANKDILSDLILLCFIVATTSYLSPPPGRPLTINSQKCDIMSHDFFKNQCFT